jgi:hypothetical protein
VSADGGSVEPQIEMRVLVVAGATIKTDTPQFFAGS